jgi:hypothetical protein
VFGLLLLLMIGAAIFAYFKLKSGEVLRFETTATPRQVTMAAVGIIGARRKWATMSQGDGAVQFSFHKRPRWWLVVLLGITLVGFPIAIVYALLAGKTEALAVNTDDSTDGMTIVQIASNGWRGKSAGRALRHEVGLAPAAIASMAPTRGEGELDPGAAAEIERQSTQGRFERVDEPVGEREG